MRPLRRWSPRLRAGEQRGDGGAQLGHLAAVEQLRAPARGARERDQRRSDAVTGVG
jgi:hypothetical protein